MGRKRILILASAFIAILVLVFATRAMGATGGIRASFYNLYYTIAGTEKSVESLEQLHLTISEVPGGEFDKNRADAQTASAPCISCHGNMLQLNEHGKPTNPVHYKMLTAPMLAFACTDCHKRVNIRKRRPGRATFKIDRKLCIKCHNPQIVGSIQEGTPNVELGQKMAPNMPPILPLHGTEYDVKKAKGWIKRHPRVAMTIGVKQCRRCHIEGSEMDFCNHCHMRGGFRPSHHQPVYKVKINEIYPEKKRTEIVEAKWIGFHFVFVRNALMRMGVKEQDITCQNLPMEKIEKLTCSACHVLTDWCTRCHIKHNPKWLNPEVGHPSFVFKYGAQYCMRCHDSRGTKCVSCHTYVGQMQIRK